MDIKPSQGNVVSMTCGDKLDKPSSRPKHYLTADDELDRDVRTELEHLLGDSGRLFCKLERRTQNKYLGVPDTLVHSAQRRQEECGRFSSSGL